MAQNVGKTQQIPMHKHQVNDNYPQNVVECHQSVQALPMVHEQTHERLAQQWVEVEKKKEEEHQVVVLKELVAQKLEFQYELKVVGQEDLPRWVHPEYELEKKLELVQEQEEHHQEHEKTQFETTAHLEPELLVPLRVAPGSLAKQMEKQKPSGGLHLPDETS